MGFHFGSSKACQFAANALHQMLASLVGGSSRVYSPVLVRHGGSVQFGTGMNIAASGGGGSFRGGVERFRDKLGFTDKTNGPGNFRPPSGAAQEPPKVRRTWLKPFRQASRCVRTAGTARRDAGG